MNITPIDKIAEGASDKCAASAWGYFNGGSAGAYEEMRWYENNKDLGGPRHVREERFKPHILAAINEAIQQERERTCEWVQDGCGAFKTECGKYLCFEDRPNFKEYPHCNGCGRRVKPPSTDSNEMGREG